MPMDPADIATCVADDGPADSTGAAPAATPIVQTSLFSYPTFRSLVDALAAEHDHSVYTRGRNPTVRALEGKLAHLERGEACTCYASGMAAISAVLLGLLRSGDHVLFVNQIYGPTLQLASRLERFGIAHDVLLDLDAAAVAAALRPETRLVWLESPGTMLFRELDIESITAVARRHGALTCIDNTWATPLFQKPLELGADIVVHTGSKYLSGHSDVMAGAVITTAARDRDLFHGAYLLNGGLLAPFEAWLVLRGLRTLPARLGRHEADGLAVARFLAVHPAVRRVHHPDLAPDGAPFARQRSGASGVFSFELVRADFATVARVIDALRLFRIGVSWGGVESLVISPERGEDGGRLEAYGLPRGLIRLSVGLEGADALTADLATALELAA